MNRESGLLLPLFSLPGKFGIGTMGHEAFSFIDFLAASGQSWWQLLPLGPTGFGDSPYQSFSSFAGNPYFIDPALLFADGLLSRAELEAAVMPAGPVDYGTLYQHRPKMLSAAFHRGWARDTGAVAAFVAQNPWVEDYALFQALKAKFGMLPWTDWPAEDLRHREPEALARAKTAVEPAFCQELYTQFLFDCQWRALRNYAREKGIRLLGDLPFYTALDSADVWTEPQFFLLDRKLRPQAVAGVPPDAFSADGQRWGNPLYDWEAQQADGWGWWIRRLSAALERYDAVRIDHFRAFDSYWEIPADAKTARTGQWRDGPGRALLDVLRSWFPGLPLVAEDLGELRESVHQLRRDCGFPGMRVLQFAFDTPGQNEHQPHCYTADCICYVGTHDNDTARGWLNTAPGAVLNRARDYLGLNNHEGAIPGLIRGIMASGAALCILRPQDLLELGNEARINTPGTAAGNWSWRLSPKALTPTLAEQLLTITRRYGRV